MPVVHVTTWTTENYTATNCSSTNASDCVLSRNVSKVETRDATLCSLALVASSLPSRLELGTVTFAVAVPIGLSVTPSVANVSLGETMEFAVAVVNGYGAVAASVSGSATLMLSGCADAAWITNASTLQLLAGRSRFAWTPTREVSNCTLQIRLVPTVSQGQAYDSNATVRVAKPIQLSVSLAPVMKTGTAVSVIVEMQDATGALVPARSPPASASNGGTLRTAPYSKQAQRQSRVRSSRARCTRRFHSLPCREAPAQQPETGTTLRTDPPRQR
jgi:hypothetical protein